MNVLAVNLAGVTLMVAVVWWFWLAGRRKAVSASEGRVDIHVANGVYVPDRVQVKAGITTHFRFIREDPAPCAEVVRFEGLDISRELPLGEAVELAIRYDERGEYTFTCQMGMYRGHVLVL
jgi:plastocyanin domain-containing protein